MYKLVRGETALPPGKNPGYCAYTRVVFIGPTGVEYEFGWRHREPVVLNLCVWSKRRSDYFANACPGEEEYEYEQRITRRIAQRLLPLVEPYLPR